MTRIQILARPEVAGQFTTDSTELKHLLRGGLQRRDLRVSRPTERIALLRILQIAASTVLFLLMA